MFKFLRAAAMAAIAAVCLAAPLAAQAQVAPFVADGVTVPINISTATTTKLVTATAGKKTYVTFDKVIAGGTGNITFEYGHGSTCGTGTTALTGAINLAAQAGWVEGNGAGAVMTAPAGEDLCVVTSAGVQMSGQLVYVQYPG